jgi:hypothetical protein
MDMYEAFRDSRFRDIGDLPTSFKLYEFKSILARPFTLNELYILSAGTRVKSVLHVLRAAQMVVSCDINDLTEGDLLYVLAWIRKNSYPESPVNATWVCANTILTDQYNSVLSIDKALGKSMKEIDRIGWTLKKCGHENVYLSHGASMSVKILEKIDLPVGLCYPIVGTLVEEEELLDDPEFKHIVGALRWIKQGETIKDKFDYVKSLGNLDLFNQAMSLSKQGISHGVTETIPIECMTCSHKQTIRGIVPNLIKFFAGYTDTSLYNMQYNLASAFNINIEDSMPSQKLLYIHSSFVKDLNHKKELAANQAAQKRRGR